MFQITILSRKFEFPTKTLDNLFKFSAHDSDLEFFEPHRTFWQKATLNYSPEHFLWHWVIIIISLHCVPFYTMFFSLFIQIVFCVDLTTFGASQINCARLGPSQRVDVLTHQKSKTRNSGCSWRWFHFDCGAKSPRTNKRRIKNWNIFTCFELLW